MWPAKPNRKTLAFTPDFSCFQGVYDFDNILKEGQTLVNCDHAPMHRQLIPELRTLVECQAANSQGNLEQALASLDSIDFKYLHYDQQTLLHCCVEMFRRLDLIDPLGL